MARWTGQPRMPPQERLHEGLGGGLGDCFTCSGAAARGGFCFGEFFCGWTEGGCGGEGLTTGVVRHACRHRVTARGVFGFVGGGALLPFVLRACCGSMCWPVDRPATHAAAGAAARGGFCFGEFFCGWTEGGCGGEGLTTGVVRHACRHRVTARGVFVLGDSFTRSELGNDTEDNRRELFHPRRRAVSCEAALRILSKGESCPPGGGDSGYFPSACAK